MFYKLELCRVLRKFLTAVIRFFLNLLGTILGISIGMESMTSPDDVQMSHKSQNQIVFIRNQLVLQVLFVAYLFVKMSNMSASELRSKATIQRLLENEVNSLTDHNS